MQLTFDKIIEKCCFCEKLNGCKLLGKFSKG